jgi:hypothetical protein
VESYSIIINFFTGNNRAQNNAFNETLTLLKTKLKFEEQKLWLFMKSDGVFFEAVIVQNPSKIYTFDESGNDQNLIKFNGVKDSQGNIIDDIYTFNNISDLSFCSFISRRSKSDELSGLNRVLLELRSNQSMRGLVQEIGKQGHEDFANLSSSVD